MKLLPQEGDPKEEYLKKLPQNASDSEKRETPLRVGIIGGGQLAWMLGLSAKALGIDLWVQTPQATDPAVAIATQTLLAPLQDLEAVAQLAAHCQVITFENEFVNLDGLQTLADRGVQFRPSLQTLSPLLDKYEQRCYLHQLGLPTPQFLALKSLENTQSGQEAKPITSPFGFPVVLKARRHGYDGKGTRIISDQATFQDILQDQGTDPFLLEAFVPFERELAVIAARSPTGDFALYPIVETQQQDQVCRVVLAPARVESEVVNQVERIVKTLLTHLQAVGVFGIELFLTPDGKIWVNEISPRTHNSGHYSLDACHTSQFEQQLRAISGLPLGNPNLKVPGAVMVNLLGYETARSDYLSQRQDLQQIPRSSLYWYGKTEARPGRKLGHITVCLQSTSPQVRQQEALEIVATIDRIWYP